MTEERMAYAIWIVAGEDEQRKTCKADGCGCDVFTEVGYRELPVRVQAVCASGHPNNFRATPPNTLVVRPA